MIKQISVTNGHASKTKNKLIMKQKTEKEERPEYKHLNIENNLQSKSNIFNGRKPKIIDRQINNETTK